MTARETRWKRWLFLLVAVAGLYLILPQLGVFHLSWRVLRRTRFPDLIFVAGFTAATYLAAAANYYLLAFRNLRYGRTVIMQLASMFAGRLLPASVGGIGVNYAYLRKARQSPAQAASQITVNNTLGFVGHMLLVGIVLALWHAQLAAPRLPHLEHFSWTSIVLIIALLAGFGLLIAMGQLRRRLEQGVGRVLKQVLAYRHHPWRLGTVLLVSVSLTMCNVLGLYFAALSLGVSISLAAVLVVFTLGVTLGTVTPTPGGLGGVEAGLIAGLIAYHVSSTDALAVVLLYRLVSYWLALLVGAGAFVLAERRGYFV
jgi:uncharacterized protein (TIRG00374 family)